MKLKAGDNVCVYTSSDYYDHATLKKTKVLGFYSYGIYMKDLGVIPFTPIRFIRFYGVGYDSVERYITVKKKWHRYPAVICEWIRLKLPQKISKKIFGI